MYVNIAARIDGGRMPQQCAPASTASIRLIRAHRACWNSQTVQGLTSTSCVRQRCSRAVQ